jgi:FkbM family methyltransferase
MRNALLWLAQFVPVRARPWLARQQGLTKMMTRALDGGGMQVVRVRGGGLDGIMLELDPSHEKAFWSGTHEVSIQQLLLGEVRAEMVCWDVGAHIGFFSLMLARRARLVVAVEAHPVNAARLRRNVELNDLPVQVVEAAVWSVPGTVSLQVAPMSGMHAVVGAHGEGTIDVPAVTLDQLAVDNPPPDLVKIDVEGAEVAVLEGATSALRHTSFVLCETHGREARRGAHARLEQLGFSVAEAGDDYLVARRAPS